MVAILYIRRDTMVKKYSSIVVAMLTMCSLSYASEADHKAIDRKARMEGLRKLSDEALRGLHHDATVVHAADTSEPQRNSRDADSTRRSSLPRKNGGSTQPTSLPRSKSLTDLGGYDQGARDAAFMSIQCEAKKQVGQLATLSAVEALALQRPLLNGRGSLRMNRKAATQVVKGLPKAGVLDLLYLHISSPITAFNPVNALPLDKHGNEMLGKIEQSIKDLQAKLALLKPTS